MDKLFSRIDDKGREKQCKDCIFYKLDSPQSVYELDDRVYIVPATTGRCFRFPPTISYERPKVYAGDWCGEYQRY